jgi:hypothetical protein
MPSLRKDLHRNEVQQTESVLDYLDKHKKYNPRNIHNLILGGSYETFKGKDVQFVNSVVSFFNSIDSNLHLVGSVIKNALAGLPRTYSDIDFLAFQGSPCTTRDLEGIITYLRIARKSNFLYRVNDWSYIGIQENKVKLATYADCTDAIQYTVEIKSRRSRTPIRISFAPKVNTYPLDLEE